MVSLSSTGRLLAALEGCYEAPRAAALSGVPISTVYHWARQGVVVPSVSRDKPKRWSYADLMVLRMVHWLRHPKAEGEAASPMGEVRRVLTQLDERGLDIWTAERGSPCSPLQVDREGRIYIVVESIETSYGEGILEGTLDLLGPFGRGNDRGPDLIRPRPHLRIVPGKLSGEPHLIDSRVTTQTVAALYRRLGAVDRVLALYPDLDAVAVGEAIDLEQVLAA